MTDSTAGIWNQKSGIYLNTDGSLSLFGNNKTILTADLNQTLNITSNTNIAGQLALTTPLGITSGGTGISAYAAGDLLIGGSANTLTKISKAIQNNLCLVSNLNSTYGLSWNGLGNVLPSAMINGNFGSIITNSTVSYSMPAFSIYNETRTSIITLDTINLNLLSNGLNGIAQSAVLTGTISPASLTTAISGTAFATDLRVGDSIQAGSENRTITAINSSTSIVLDTAFTLLNQWAGSAVLDASLFKFGTRSLSIVANTDYASLITGSSFGFVPSISWTIEFFINLSRTNANQNIFTSEQSTSIIVGFSKTTKNFSVSLSSSGSSFDIANSALIAGTINNSTWYHLALVYDGGSYRCFLNGTLALVIAVATSITSGSFTQFRVGGDGVLGGTCNLDELRLSNSARYMSAFTPPSTMFTMDANTVALNHFEQSNINNGDDTINNTSTYRRGGIASNKIYYLYALNHATAPGYLVSRDSSLSTLRDIPSGYSAADARQLSMYFSMGLNQTPNSTIKIGSRYSISPNILLISASSSITPITVNLANMVPNNCRVISVLISHVHVGTTAVAVTVDADNYLTSAVAGTYQLVIEIQLDTSQQFTTNLSAVSSTTTFSIAMVAFSV